jgi:hypothetical protein
MDFAIHWAQAVSASIPTESVGNFSLLQFAGFAYLQPHIGRVKKPSNAEKQDFFQAMQ